MDNNNIEKEIHQELSSADQERLEAYMRMFDRILLYTMAANAMPPEAIDKTINLWDKTIKKMINMDSKTRTNFLESTTQGRLSKFHKEPDGEDLRLYLLKTWKIARKIVTANLINPTDEDDYTNQSEVIE